MMHSLLLMAKGIATCTHIIVAIVIVLHVIAILSHTYSSNSWSWLSLWLNF